MKAVRSAVRQATLGKTDWLMPADYARPFALNPASLAGYLKHKIASGNLELFLIVFNRKTMAMAVGGWNSRHSAIAQAVWPGVFRGFVKEESTPPNPDFTGVFCVRFSVRISLIT